MGYLGTYHTMFSRGRIFKIYLLFADFTNVLLDLLTFTRLFTYFVQWGF